MKFPPSQPNPHKPDCKCPIHDKEERTCQWCGKKVIGGRALGSHVSFAHRERAVRRRPRLVPDGQGFVKRVLSEGTVNVSALTRFSKTLYISAQTGNSRRFSPRALKNQIAYYDELGDKWTQMTYACLPASLLALIGRLSLLAGTPTRSTLAALVTYGVEQLASELRATRCASTPHLPQDFAINLKKRYNELKNPSKTTLPEAEE